MRVVRSVLTPSSTRSSSSSSAAFVGIPLSHASASRVLLARSAAEVSVVLPTPAGPRSTMPELGLASASLKWAMSRSCFAAAEHGGVGRDAVAEQALLETEMRVVHGPRLPFADAVGRPEVCRRRTGRFVIPRHNLCKTAMAAGGPGRSL